MKTTPQRNPPATHQYFELASEVPVSAKSLYEWHGRPGAFERLTPPFERAQVVSRVGGIAPGDRTTIRVPLGPVKTEWIAEHAALEDAVDGARVVDGVHGFRDVQVRGPFAAWEHEHRFEPQGPDHSTLRDRIDYELPLGLIGRIGGKRIAAGKLERMFEYRHRTTIDDLELHAAVGQRLEQAGTARLRVAISGATGLVGTSLCALLSTGGHRVRKLVRGPASSSASNDERNIPWDPAAGQIDATRLEGFDAVIHLAGENVAGRWTAAKRRRIRDSRVLGTELLARTLARLDSPPKVLISASAIGIYGDRGEEQLADDAPPGSGFLADVVVEWEAAAEAARESGIRVVHPRIGVVLDPRGGALAKLLPPFKLGAGGRLGSGRQWWSWIGIDDCVGALLHAVASPNLSGPLNVVAPEPLRNAEFARVLAHVLSRPAIIPTPSTALRLALGDMADEMLLASQRAVPKALLEDGYRMRFSSLEPALRHVLGRPVRA